MTTRSVVALDLGASSGRIFEAQVGGDRLELRAVARFENRPVARGGTLYWDVLRLWSDALDGLRGLDRDRPPASIGVDAWGVDYGLLRRGELLANPRHYRDVRHRRGQDLVHARMQPSTLYARNGLQQLPINTLYQLAAEADEGLADVADGLLMTPELIASWLSGVSVAERSSASTSGLLNAVTGNWDIELMGLARVDPALFAPLVDAGVRIGSGTGEAVDAVGAGFDVVAVGSHDTASAIAAVPMDPRRAVFISCGTWGLVGVERDAPLLSAATYAEGFTNERGVDGTTTVLRNIMGLWLLNETLRWWSMSGKRYEHADAVREAAALPVSRHVFDVDDPSLATPGDVPGRIRRWFRDRELPEPQGDAALIRCIIDSLAQAFADTVRAVSRLVEAQTEVVHVVGGGALNGLLCQQLADRAGLPVVAGPVEATAIGNVLVQARTAGMLSGSLRELRDVVRRTQPTSHYLPAG